MYNETSNSWTQFPDVLGHYRDRLAAASLPSGLVFFAGGYGHSAPGGASAYVDVYNATSNSWIRFPNGLGIARYSLAAASLPSGLVFFAGGQGVAGLSADVDMYNATSNNWTHFPAQLGQARYGLAAASLPSGLVFFAGGHSE
jgi:N-acetylneuraminic acid mutarotase